LRIVLLFLVIAIGADAILYGGQHTQSAWRAVTNGIERLSNDRGEQQRTELRQ
jgi:hypothetical protein